MAEEGERAPGERPRRELPLGSRTRGPGQPASPSAAAPPSSVASAVAVARQVALAAERQAVAVRRLRWREALEHPADAAPSIPGPPTPAPSGEPGPASVSSSAVLRALLARTGRRIRRSLGLDARPSDGG